MMWTRTIALIAAIVIGAVAISTGHIQAQVEAADRRANADLAEAAADRRAWHASMDAFREKADADRKAFRVEMCRLAERQARLEEINTAARQ